MTVVVVVVVVSAGGVRPRDLLLRCTSARDVHHSPHRNRTDVLFVLGTEAARLCKAASKLHAANRTFTLKEMRREANVEDERNAEEVAVHLLSLLCYAGFMIVRQV